MFAANGGEQRRIVEIVPSIIPRFDQPKIIAVAAIPSTLREEFSSQNIMRDECMKITGHVRQLDGDVEETVNRYARRMGTMEYCRPILSLFDLNSPEQGRYSS